MSLIPVVSLGPYEIVGSLGAGGMGEVYRARDSRLNRDVAIKVLPQTLASDPDRRGAIRAGSTNDSVAVASEYPCHLRHRNPRWPVVHRDRTAPWRNTAITVPSPTICGC